MGKFHQTSRSEKERTFDETPPVCSDEVSKDKFVGWPSQNIPISSADLSCGLTVGRAGKGDEVPRDAVNRCSGIGQNGRK